MICDDARERFSSWVDETLSPAERAEVASHVEGCADCRRELDRFGEAVLLLQRLDRPRAPAGFVDRVLQAARPTPWYRRLARRLFVPLGVKLPAEAAAVLLIAGLAVFVFQRTPELQHAARREENAVTTSAQGAPTPPAAVAPETTAPASRVEPEARLEATMKKRDVAPPSPPPAAVTSETPPAPEASGEHKTEAKVDNAPAMERLHRSPSFSMEERNRALAEKTPRALAPSPSAMRILRSADVVGRLSVKDRDAAERALADLLVRVRGSEISRRDEPGATVVDVVVPRASFAEFTLQMARVGSWQPEGEPSESSSQIRITVRLE